MRINSNEQNILLSQTRAVRLKDDPFRTPSTLARRQTCAVKQQLTCAVVLAVVHHVVLVDCSRVPIDTQCIIVLSRVILKTINS